MESYYPDEAETQSLGTVTLIRTAARRSEIAAVVVDSAFPAVEEVIGRAIRIKAMRPGQNLSQFLCR